MPTGMWRRRPPLPPTEGTSVVCPIGEATPEAAERYRRERDAAELDATLYLLACLTCAEEPSADASVIPFGSPAERGKWAAAHTRGTGHDRWWVHDERDDPDRD